MEGEWEVALEDWQAQVSERWAGVFSQLSRWIPHGALCQGAGQRRRPVSEPQKLGRAKTT